MRDLHELLWYLTEALTLLPQGTSVRRGRLGDVAESVALLALLPTLVIATGVFSSISG